MKEELSLIVVKNPFDRRERDETIEPWKEQTLADLKARFAPDVDVTISVMGSPIPQEIWNEYIPLKGEQVVMIPVVEGDDGLRSALMIVVMVAAIWVTGGGAATAGGLFAQGSTSAMMLSAGVMMAGSYAVNQALPVKMPGVAPGIDSSPTYSWNPQTIQQQGAALPIFYGRNRVVGNIIAASVEDAGETGGKQYLNVLIALCQGPIADIDVNTMKINGQPRSVWDANGLQVSVRRGFLNQAPIIFPGGAGFGDTRTQCPVALLVKNSACSYIGAVYSCKVEHLSTSGNPPPNSTYWQLEPTWTVAAAWVAGTVYSPPYVYTTQGDAFQKLEVEITAPGGLFHVGDNGNMYVWNSKILVEARKVGDDAWTPISRQAQSYKYFAGIYWSLGYSSGNIHDGKTWHEVDFEYDLDLHYDGQAGIRNGKSYTWRKWDYHSVGGIANETNDYYTMSGAQTQPIRKVFSTEGPFGPALPAGHYEVRVSSLNINKTDARYGDELYLGSVTEVLTDDFAYPGVALVGLRALATDHMNGQFNFSVEIDGMLCMEPDTPQAAFTTADGAPLKILAVR